MAKIIINNVTFKYNDAFIVEDINVMVNSGEIVCFFGPSGCGKSTLIKCILGLVPVTSGRITIDSEDALDYDQPISYLPQNNELFKWRSVNRNIMLWALESKKKAINHTGMETARALKVTEMYEKKEKMPYELSGGMSRRAALARCLATHSALMLLDEAFISVERRLRRKLMYEIRSHIKNNNITSVLVSHDYEEAIFMSDRIVFLTALPAKVSKIQVVNLPENRSESIFLSKEFSNAMLATLGE